MGSSTSKSEEKYKITIPAKNLVVLYIELKTNAKRRNNLGGHHLKCINCVFYSIFDMLRTSNVNMSDRLNYIILGNNFTSFKKKKRSSSFNIKLSDYDFICEDNTDSPLLKDIYGIINDDLDYNKIDDIKLLKLYLLITFCKILLQLPPQDLNKFANPRNYFAGNIIPLFQGKYLPVTHMEFWDFFVEFLTNHTLDPYSYKILIHHTRCKFSFIDYSLWFTTT